MKMTTLCKKYGVHSDTSYFDIVNDSYINGQMEQAKKQFSAMSRADRKSFLIWLLNIEPDTSPNGHKYRLFLGLI